LHSNNKTPIFTQRKNKMTVEKLIEEHKLAKLETWEQLNELKQFDTSKFSEKEKEEITLSLMEIQMEYSMRCLFVSELESLL
jgi:hypothetical protein